MKAVVVHSSPPVRSGLAELLRESLPGLDEVLEAAHTVACLEAVVGHDVAVAVLGDTSRAASATNVCRQLSDRGVAVVALIDSSEGDHLDLLEAGASALVLLDVDEPSSLVEAVATVLAGHAYVPPRLLGSLLRGLVQRDRDSRVGAADPSRLSPRERQVLALLAAGQDDRDIAKALVISPHTAKTHVTRVLGKLGVTSRIEAAAIAVEHGMVTRVRRAQ